MHGTDVKDLNVYAKGAQTGKQQTIAHLSGPWSVQSDSKKPIFGQDGDWWNEHQVEFTSTEPFRVSDLQQRGGINAN